MIAAGDGRRRERRPARRRCCTTWARRSTTRSRARTPCSAPTWRSASTCSPAVVHCIEAHHDEVEARRSRRSSCRSPTRSAAPAGRAPRDAGALHQAAGGAGGASRTPSRASRRRSPSRPGARCASSSSPSEIDDLEAMRLARDVSKKIEETLEYPGQIKVTVVRETRAVGVRALGRHSGLSVGGEQSRDAPTVQ